MRVRLKKNKNSEVYVITKDIYFETEDGNGHVAVDPIEVLATKEVAENHVARLTAVAPKLADLLKTSGKYKSCQVAFRCAVLNKQKNDMVEQILHALEKDEETDDGREQK